MSDPLVLLTALIAVGTIALAMFSLWQTIIARNLARRQIRAYVGVNGGKVELDASGTSALIHIVYFNAGQSPAYAFTTWLKAEIDIPTALLFESELSISERTGSSVCMPSAHANSCILQVISAQELHDLRAGVKMLFIWGGVDYEDAFKEKRYLKLRATAQVDSGNVWAIQPHKIGYVSN